MEKAGKAGDTKGRGSMNDKVTPVSNASFYNIGGQMGDIDMPFTRSHLFLSPDSMIEMKRERIKLRFSLTPCRIYRLRSYVQDEDEAMVPERPG
ncbi:unnamed protein product [Allacma fusca]|uniref:Uncharacterized protein n=1 Tax=Allacma fusca TaxID=39272 RepID=A0A8J2JMU4_9HEXA|nr:unnamed protein product [Allacma fusca]